MFRLIYVSTAVRLLNKDELVEILNVSREKNARLNITGLLLYKDGNFMQLLEGRKEDVLALYDVIVRATDTDWQLPGRQQLLRQSCQFGDGPSRRLDRLFRFRFTFIDDTREGFSQTLNDTLPLTICSRDGSTLF